MKLKIDENLPDECAEFLKGVGFDVDTVANERLAGAADAAIAARVLAERRVLITLDLDFANVQVYPPSEYAGILVLRSKRQDKDTVLALVRRLALVLANRAPAAELWIVEADRIRFRSGGKHQNE